VVAETIAAAAGEGRGVKGPRSTCGTALLFTYNAHPNAHTHVPSGGCLQLQSMPRDHGHGLFICSVK